MPALLVSGSPGLPAALPATSWPRGVDFRNAAFPPGPSRGRPAVPPPARALLAGVAPGSPARPRLGAPGGGTGTGSRGSRAGAGARASDARLLPARRSMGLGAGPAGRGCSPGGWRSGRASRGSGEALIIPSARPTRRFFSLGFGFFFFFRCGTFCKLFFFFLTCKAVTTNCSGPPRGGGRRGGGGKGGLLGLLSLPQHRGGVR